MRLFLAADIPEELKEAIHQALLPVQREWKGLPVKWVEPENLHLTLKFLGEQPPKRAEEIVDCLKEMSFSSFQARIREGNYFSGGGRPRVLFFRVEAPELQELAARIDKMMTPLGFEPEKRAFQGHLTAGRIKGNLPLEKLKIFRERTEAFREEFEVRHFTLYESLLNQKGPVYIVRNRFELG